MSIFRSRYFRPLAGLALGGAVTAALACGGGEKIVEVTRVVEKTSAPVVQTVVVKETSAPQVQTVVVKETSVVQQTVVVKETVQVAVTATATPIPVPKGIEQVPVPDSKTPVGAVTVADEGDPLDENGRNQAQSPESIHYWAIGETMFLRADDDSALPWLADSYNITINNGVYHATLKIAQNVPFQKIPGKVNTSGDWGMLTAEDVAWSMNDSNACTNPQSIHGQAGDFNGLWCEWIATDANTIDFDFTSFDGTWKDDFLNQSGQAFVVFSKKAFDTEGADWVRDNVVATGPFQIESWTRSDKVTLISRYSSGGQHWKPEMTPKTGKIIHIYVPDSVTRVAMMKTGEADITQLPLKDLPQFTKDGKSFATTGTGGTDQEGIFFSGNLWEKVSATDGVTPLVRGTYVHDLPWIGNPDQPDDMEEARLIRTALSMSYDRDAINKALLSGLGWPAEVQYVSIKHPRFQKNPALGWQNADGTENVSNLKWAYGYNVAAARALIMSDGVQADYQKGSASSNGPLGNKAFEVSLYSQQPSEIRAELQDAIAGYWQDLGLTVFTLKFSYQTFRPTVVGRTNVHPWVTQCDKGNEAWPWTSPKGLVQTSLTRGGFGCGFEIPFVLDNYRAVAVETDSAKAAALVDDYVAYMYEQALQPGIVSIPTLVLYNTKKVKSWPMPKNATSGADGWWNLELQAGK